jgi:ribosomal-protein-alanine N-acetyltransferase
MGPTHLESDRLEYRPLSTAHCSLEYLDWMNDPIVYQFLESGGGYTFEMLSDYLANIEKKAILAWGIHRKDSGKHIGNIKIDPVNMRHGLAEYGILIGDKDAWGKGYAKEASKAIITHCFEKFGIRKITLGVVAENLSAVKLYKSLGFEIEGNYKNHGIYNGDVMDVLRMAIFNPKFQYAK